MDREIREYEDGKVSYVMVRFWTAVTWQTSCIGLFGLIFEVSSLFSIVIYTMELPIVPFLAAIFFHDKINAMKVMAFVLALWGFLSYVYQQYQDDKKAKADTNTSDDDDFVVGDFRLQGLKKSRNYGPTVCEVNYSNLFCY